jgi:hypothetical protein
LKTSKSCDKKRFGTEKEGIFMVSASKKDVAKVKLARSKPQINTIKMITPRV